MFRSLFKNSAPVTSVAPAEPKPAEPAVPDLLGHNGQLFTDLKNNYIFYLKKLMWMKYNSKLSEKELNKYAREEDGGFEKPEVYDPNNYIIIFEQPLKN
jgi:hypothetical protein